jgi:hypothetical protein
MLRQLVMNVSFDEDNCMCSKARTGERGCAEGYRKILV